MRYKSFVFSVLAFFMSLGMNAQNIVLPEDPEGFVTDSLAVLQAAVVKRLDYDAVMDSLKISLVAPDSLHSAMIRHIERNTGKKEPVYRLRIFFDNSRNARMVSDTIKTGFMERYPDIPIYRIYDNPYWKLTVGDFREKSHAMKTMELLREEFPSVFLVKESLSTN